MATSSARPSSSGHYARANRSVSEVNTRQEDYLACAELACAALDNVEEYCVADGDAAGLLVLHGLAMYARDTARGTSALLRDGQTLAAAVLSRVVIEHAVLAQWLKLDPEARSSLFLKQSEVERSRWWEVVLAANPDMAVPATAAPNMTENERGAMRKPKSVAPEFDTPKNLFGNTDAGRQMYLTYRNLSKFVHPSAATFARYTSRLKSGLELSSRLQVEQDAEAISFDLASAVVMCTLPYLEMLGDVVAGVKVRVAARTTRVATSLD